MIKDCIFIPISKVRFISPQDADGLSVTETLSSSKQWSIDYEPRLRWYRVRNYQAGATIRESWIPEHRVMFHVVARESTVVDRHPTAKKE